MIEKEQHLPFCTRLVRVLLPSGICHYYGKEGETEPPREEDTPSVRYLAYGSSITHGSLSLILPFSYPFLIAEALLIRAMPVLHLWRLRWLNIWYPEKTGILLHWNWE